MSEEQNNIVDISLAQEAVQLVNSTRSKAYGHPRDNFQRIALIWSSILDIEVKPEQVALCMVGVKLSREVNEKKRDNIVDAIGYLLTYNASMKKE